MIVLRCNISEKLGSGHLFRCLMLSKLIHITPKYLLVNDKLNYINRHNIHQKSLKIIKIHSYKEEIVQLSKLSKQNKRKLIILDLKDTSADYILYLKSQGFKIVSIDDLGEGRNFVDLLVDANIHENVKSDNNFFGEKYILLDPFYAKFNSKEKKIVEIPKKIFLFFGGTDPENICGFLLENYEKTLLKNYYVTILTSKKFNVNFDNMKIYSTPLAPFKIAELYFKNDISIISGGISVYESLSVGCPSVIINQNNEQYQNTQYFKDITLNLGIFKRDTLIERLNKVLLEVEDINVRLKNSQNGKKMIDGLGYIRIINSVKSIYKGK